MFAGRCMRTSDSSLLPSIAEQSEVSCPRPSPAGILSNPTTGALLSPITSIVARAIDRSDGDRRFLTTVDIAVPRSARTGLLGENGVGKSTLRCIRRRDRRV